MPGQHGGLVQSWVLVGARRWLEAVRVAQHADPHREIVQEPLDVTWIAPAEHLGHRPLPVGIDDPRQRCAADQLADIVSGAVLGHRGEIELDLDDLLEEMGLTPSGRVVQYLVDAAPVEPQIHADAGHVEKEDNRPRASL